MDSARRVRPDYPIGQLHFSTYIGDVAYTVFIDDNFHYQDESERVLHGQFETPAEAVAACKAIVDNWLAGAFEPGMSATALWDAYKGFGPDPFFCSSISKRRQRSILALGGMPVSGAK